MTASMSHLSAFLVLAVAAALHIASSSAVVQQGRADDAASAEVASGASAPLTDQGYDQVSKLHSDMEMKQFIVRLLSVHGMTVQEKSVGEFDGFVPWFSGVAAVQSFKHLLAELMSAAWVTEITSEDNLADKVAPVIKDDQHIENASPSSSKGKHAQNVALAEENVALAEEDTWKSVADSAVGENLEEKEQEENEKEEVEMPSIGWSMGPRVGSSGQKHCLVGESSEASGAEMTLEDAQIACDADEKCNFVWSHGCDMSWRKCFAQVPVGSAGDKSSCTLIKPTKGLAASGGDPLESATHAVQQLILQALLESDIDRVPAEVVEELKKTKHNRTVNSWNEPAFLEELDETSMEEGEDGNDVDEDLESDYSEDDALMQKKEMSRREKAKVGRMAKLVKWLLTR